MARRRRLAPDVDRLNLRLALAVGAAVLVYAATGWPVGALASAAFGWSAPTLVGAKAARAGDRPHRRRRAVGGAAARHHDGRAGLHEAIGVTARWHRSPSGPRWRSWRPGCKVNAYPCSCGGSHRASPTRPAIRWPSPFCWPPNGTGPAGRRARPRGRCRPRRGHARLRIEAQRARAASQARLVSGVIASVVAIYVVLNRSYLAPFGTPLGQVVLAAVCGLWFLSFWALVRLASVEPGSRLLAVDP